MHTPKKITPPNNAKNSNIDINNLNRKWLNEKLINIMHCAFYKNKGFLNKKQANNKNATFKT